MTDIAPILSAASPRADDARDLLADISEGSTAAQVGVVDPRGVLLALVGRDGRIAWREDGFDALAGSALGDDVQSLIDEAATSGVATGVVATPARGPLALQARAGAWRARWPLPEAAAETIERAPGHILLIAFSPSRSTDWAFESARALGLSSREAELAGALLETPNLEMAATRLGISRETAKDALARACRRVGAASASDLISRLLDLSCSAAVDVQGRVGGALGLTPAEARVAAGVARGEAVGSAARALGVAETTVKTHRKAIFAKTGASGERDLRRLLLEVSGALALEDADEIVFDQRSVGERLRLVHRHERRIALIDYGPASGRPLLLMHGHNDWRRAPPPLLARLHRDGWRPIIVQRPGFGLTDPARGDYLEAAADDMAEVLQELRTEPATLFARGPSAATALAFAERHPGRFRRGVIANPHPTRAHAPHGDSLLFQMFRLALTQPRLASAVVDQALKRTTTRALSGLIERMYAGTEDRLPPDRPEILQHCVRDVQALYARTTRGVIDELSVYARGWSTPRRVPAGPWRVAVSEQSWSRDEAQTLVHLPGHERRDIEGVVVLRAYTHPDMLADLLVD